MAGNHVSIWKGKRERHTLAAGAFKLEPLAARHSDRAIPSGVTSGRRCLRSVGPEAVDQAMEHLLHFDAPADRGSRTRPEE
ncbi:MAG TPA: hypothetical protein VJB15_09020 [Rhodothermia bacterium]|nr:hypothetical protein [Rhodothermia bacterium]